LVTTRQLISTDTEICATKKQGISPVFFREFIMNTLILLAALSSQITFKTSQQENMTTIIPQVTLTQSCDCQVQIVSLREGQGGQSSSRQQNTLFIPANQTIDLMRLSLNINAGDTVKIVVTVTDGKSLHLSQQWSPAERPL
jgi:curli production protein